MQTNGGETPAGRLASSPEAVTVWCEHWCPSCGEATEHRRSPDTSGDGPCTSRPACPWCGLGAGCRAVTEATLTRMRSRSLMRQRW